MNAESPVVPCLIWSRHKFLPPSRLQRCKPTGFAGRAAGAELSPCQTDALSSAHKPDLSQHYVGAGRPGAGALVGAGAGGPEAGEHFSSHASMGPPPGQGTNPPYYIGLLLLPCVALGYLSLGSYKVPLVGVHHRGRTCHLLEAGAVGGGGQPSLVQGAKRLDTCRVQSYRQADPAACLGPYSHSFSGCLSDSYEAQVVGQLREGEPVADLRCGFVDSESQRWLAAVAQCCKHCTYVFYVISFAYGRLQPTEHVFNGQEGVCFVAFVDDAAKVGLPAGFNGTHFERWRVETVEPSMLADTPARASKLLRLSAPRLFPSARYSLYIDYKVNVPFNPLGIFQLAENSSSPFTLVTIKHHKKGRDVFTEFFAVLNLLVSRRLKPSGMETFKGKGVSGRDFDDVFRQYEYFRQAGFPLHHTGMIDSALLLWNHHNSCTAALACIWHNHVARYSMRIQLNFNYVVSVLGLTNQVLFLRPFTYQLGDSNSTLVPTGWPAFGTHKRDEHW